MAKRSDNKNSDTNDLEDDIVFENESTTQDQLKKLRKRLQNCVEEKQEYLGGWQRAKADLINARKEFAENTRRVTQFANENLILEIIPVLDSFDMALSGSPAGNEWWKGVAHIQSQLLAVLKDNGIKVIEPEGNEFDPNYHTSVGSKDVDMEEKNNKVVSVEKKGYLLNDKVIRPAHVIVGEYKK